MANIANMLNMTNITHMADMTNPTSETFYDQPKLTINLSALAHNAKTLNLKAKTNKSELACVVKANAYGLGLEPIAKTLAKTGCDVFYVAKAQEALSLKTLLPTKTIYVFNGLGKAHPKDFTEHKINPCLNTLSDIKKWVRHCQNEGVNHPASIHIDTGFHRLGIGLNEAEKASDLINQAGLKPTLLMSHLACADEPNHRLNQTQLQNFLKAKTFFPNVKASLANSAGLFLGQEFSFQQVRVGIALYGGLDSKLFGKSAPKLFGKSAPKLFGKSFSKLGDKLVGKSFGKSIGKSVGKSVEKSIGKSVDEFVESSVGSSVGKSGGKPICDEALEQIVKWEAPILQTRLVKKGDAIGYGATATAKQDTIIAIIATGYGDGYLRGQDDTSRFVILDGIACPLIGRVSMDLTAININAHPASSSYATSQNLIGKYVQLLGKELPLPQLAKQMGTIPYEILTRLGRQCTLLYKS